MRISSITVTNFQGLRHAALAVSEPVLLVSGDNGAGKSSLLDSISMAFTAAPRRVAKKKDLGQLVTDGQKKGEAHVSWIDQAGEEQVSWVMLPKGTTAPLIDSPYLPFVLDASHFAAQDNKERRRVLFDLAGASASPNEVAKRLLERGADPVLVEKIKPMLRSGFPAAVDQSKEYASEARGAWKAVTGEAYGSDKAEGWAPDAVQVEVTQEQIDAAAQALQNLQADLDEANQTLGSHKAAAQAAGQRQQQLENLRETAGMLQRRRDKLAADQERMVEWAQKVIDAEQAQSGAGAMDCPCCSARLIVEGGALVQFSGAVGDPEAARRVVEYRGYLESAERAVSNSQRDVTEAENAVERVAELEAEAASIPPAEAIANAEQTIAGIRQERDRASAAHLALQDVFALSASRTEMEASAAKHHEQVKAWTVVADALSPDGIPSEILADALAPINTMLAGMAEAAKWRPVQISSDIEVTYGGRAYGLLSESEKWRCDALLAVTVARLSGLRLVTLDRFDVLQPSARPQILALLRSLAQAGELDTAILAGTMKEALPKVPSGIQQVWIEAGQVATPISAAA